MKITAFRFQDIDYGHRVVGHTDSVGHPGKCSHYHGHSGRITFFCEAEKLDSVGRVIDFSDIKKRLCQYLEDTWDHHMLLWQEDPWAESMTKMDPTAVLLPFNPTAENLAAYLLNIVGPEQLKGTGVLLTKVQFDETRKCSVTVELESKDNVSSRDLDGYAKVKPVDWFN